MSMLPFLSTGLVLRSSLGQAIPIVVTYQALLAELNAGAEGSFLSMGPYVGEEEAQIINDDHGPTGRLYHNRVDPTIAQSHPSAMTPGIDIGGIDEAKRRRTPLQIRSTFDDSFEIVKLSSCNPWFDFLLGGSRTKEKPKESDLSVPREYRVYDAFALSSIRCEESNFLSCALLFLESRSLLQPAGCGLSEADAAMEYAYSPELAWDNHRYEHMLQSLSESSMTEGGGAFNLKTRKWNGNRMLDLAHARSHDIKVKDTTAANMDGKVHGDELQYAWQWLGVPFDYDSDADEEDSKQGVKSEAIDALREASKLLVAMYSESAEKLRLDRAEEPEMALVHTLDVKPFLDARNAWKKVIEQKLHLLTGDLRATIEKIPEYSDGKAIEPFTTDVPLSFLWTYLDLPSIFDSRPQEAPNATYRVDWGGTGIIDFSLTALSEVETLYVPVHNPSEMSLRVRLTTIKPFGPNETASTYSAKWDGVDHRAAWSEDDLYLFDDDISPLHVHSCTNDACSSDADRWWNGGAYYQVSGDGTTLRSRHNVTVKSTNGSSSVFADPSLHATSALITGCGRRRCGLRDDQQQQAQANQNEAIANFLKAPGRLYSTMGASAAKRVHLRGRIYDSVSGEESGESSSYKAGKCLDWFSPSCPSVHDVVPPFAISTSSLQEEIVLAPYEKAWLGPIYFRPSAASRFGSTILIENSLTGIEPIKLTGVGATRQIAFEEAGGADSTEASLEIRYGMPALMFPGTASATEPGKAVSRRVKIRNTGGLPVGLRSASLAPFSLSQVTQRPIALPTKNGARGCSVGGFTLFGCEDDGFEDDGFILQPGEVGSISISHSPRCSMKKSFVVLNLDYSSKEAGYSALADAKGSQLLVGFDMSHEEMASCVPIHPSFANKVRRVEKLYRQDRSTWNPFVWSDVIEREDSNIRKQTLLIVWPILLLMLCVAYSVGIDRKVRHRFLTTTDIDDLVPGVGNDPSMVRLLGASHGTGDSSHHKALYQVAQSDPNSADLAQAGRDQTRRLLLGKYRRVQAAMPRCLRPNGAFFYRGGAHSAATAAAPTSENEGTKLNASAKALSRGPRPARAQGSLADEIFGHSASSLSSNDTNAALPMALSWRGAATRGILPHPSRVSLGVGNRVGDLLKRRVELRRGSSYTDVLVAEAVAIVDDESEDDDSVPTTIIAPSNAAAKGIQTDSSAKAIAKKVQEDEKEDDIASLLPSTQKTKSSEKAPSQYVLPLPVSIESAIDTKGVSEGDWHIQSGGHKKAPRDTAPKHQVATGNGARTKKPRSEEHSKVQTQGSPGSSAEVPSAASTAASSATEESKRPEASKKTSR